MASKAHSFTDVFNGKWFQVAENRYIFADEWEDAEFFYQSGIYPGTSAEAVDLVFGPLTWNE